MSRPNPVFPASLDSLGERRIALAVSSLGLGYQRVVTQTGESLEEFWGN